MKNAPSCLAVLALLILTALAPTAPAQDTYTVSIESNDLPHGSTLYAAPGESVDARVIIKDVIETPVTGSSLYLNYDPEVIDNISCLSAYEESNVCEEVGPGVFKFEGYDTFGKHTGDVVLAVLQLKTNESAPEGATTDLVISAAGPGEALGTPVWGPFWEEIDTILDDGLLVLTRADSPEISVDKVAEPDEGAPGEDVTFTIILENTGNEDIDNVSVTDLLPEGMSYVSSDPEADLTGSTVVWEVTEPLIVNGSPESFSLVAQIDDDATGSLENYVETEGETPMGIPVQDSATATVSVVKDGIEIQKIADPEEGSPCTNVTFSITVLNTGSSDIESATVVDTLPEGMSYVSSDPEADQTGSTIVWEITEPLLANGSPMEFALIAHIDEGAEDDLENAVTVEGLTEDDRIVTANATALVDLLEPEIDVDKVAFPKAGEPLTPVTFQINVTNTGEVILENVTVTDILPEGMEYISSTPSGTVQGGEITWDIGTLDLNESASIEIEARIGLNATGTLENRVAAFAEANGVDVSDADVAAVRVLEKGGLPAEIHIMSIGTQRSSAMSGYGTASNSIRISSGEDLI